MSGKLANCRGRAARIAKDGRRRDQDIGAGLDYDGCRRLVDAAVHFQIAGRIQAVNQSAQLTYPSRAFLEKLLA